MDSRRAESFSDGVFAVAITVLVFNLLPVGVQLCPVAGRHCQVSGGELTRALLDAWPQYAAYVVSFLTIGIMWLNHHTMLALLERVDRPLLALNLFLLMGVVAVPFPTALVAEQLRAGSGTAARVAAVTYGLVMIAISVGFAAMWLYLTAHEQLAHGGQLRLPHLARLRFTAGLAGYAAGVLLAAFVSAAAALTGYGLIAVYYLFENLPEPAVGDSQAGASAAG